MKIKMIIKMEKEKIYLVLEISPTVTVVGSCLVGIKGVAGCLVVVGGCFTRLWYEQLGPLVTSDGDDGGGCRQLFHAAVVGTAWPV